MASNTLTERQLASQVKSKNYIPPEARNLEKINEFFYSPAELVNIYVTHKEEDKFIERLLQNKKI